MISDVAGKSVVITGSSRGIGKEIAIRFVKEGANVVVNYYHSEKEALELQDYMRSIGGKCVVVKADITSSRQVKLLYDESLKAFGKIDVLVNNAGICEDGLAVLMPEKTWKRVIDTNLTGVYLCSRAFSRAFIRQNHGTIINIASLKGQRGWSGQTNYCASKAGVIGFTKALAQELGTFNVSVNAVCPGFIVTDLNRHDAHKKKIAQDMSVLSIESNLDTLVNFIIYMSSDSFSGVSGQVFNLDSRIRSHEN